MAPKWSLLALGVLVALVTVGVLGVSVVNIQGGTEELPVQEFVLEPVSVNASESTIEFRHVAGDPIPYGNMNVTVRTSDGRAVVFGPPTSLDEGEQVAGRDTVLVVGTDPPRILAAESRVDDSADAELDEVYASPRRGGAIDLSGEDVTTVRLVFTNTRTGDVVFETSVPVA